MRLKSLWAGLAMLLGTSQALAQKSAPVIPYKIEQRELKNGLKVIVVPTGFPNLVSIQIPVQTGSRNEVEPGKTGFAHFFEHMMFRGTKSVSPDQYQAYLSKMGARQNAYTSNDYTNYHTTFAKEDLELMLRIEADRFMNLEYPEAAFKTESRAVLGEYNKNSAQPGSKLNEVVRDAAFTTHTYKHTTMGFLKDIEDMPNQFDYSRIFFDRWYRPEHTAIILAGDVQPKEAFALAEKYFGAWKRGKTVAKVPKEPAHKAPVYVHVPWPTSTLPRLYVSFHGPSFSTTNKDYAALQILFELGFGQTSPLYKKLVIEDQVADSLWSMPSDSKDPDLYTAGAMLKDGKTAVEVRDAILRTFMRFASEDVTTDDLNKVRSNMRNSIAKSLDNTESIAALLAAFTHYERNPETLNKLFDLMETVTPADLKRVAQKVFKDNEMVIATLSNGELPAGIKQIPKLASFKPDAKTAAVKAPIAPAADKSKVAAPAAGKLSASVPLVIQKNASPFLDIKILFKTGSAQDPKGKEGLSVLAASLASDASSQFKSYDEIQQALYPFAASISARVDKEMTTFTLRIPKANATELFDLLLPVLLQPGLKDQDFKRLKDEQINRLTNDLRTNNEEELGKERLQQLIFADGPYAHTALGTEAGLASLTLADVAAFQKAQYTQAALMVGINGDASPALIEDLKARLAVLPQTAQPKLAPIEAKAQDGFRVNIIQKETRATALSFGHPLPINRSHPDFAALWLARAWLGEHRSSAAHLFQRLREIRGLNYGDYAYVEAFPGGMYQFFPPSNVARQQQIFEIWIRPVAPENAHMSLRLATYELQKLIQNGLTEAQFVQTRDYLMKNVYLLTSDQSAELGYALDSEWYGIGEYTKVMRERLQKLTAAEVNRVIKKYLSAENLTVVAITQDAEGLKKQLESNAVSTIKYDAEKPKEILDEDKVVGALKLPIKDVTITPVAEIFKK